MTGAWWLGGAGVAALGLGLLLDPRQAWFSYLAAYATGLSLALGALILLMVCRLTGARWIAPYRRAALAAAGTTPLFAVLFLPIAWAPPALYPWAAAPDPVRGGWLAPGFFAGRAVLYFAVWIGATVVLRRGRAAPAAAALPAVGLTLTFAAFDWLMSLTPAWSSTIYGLYWFTGGFLASLAFLAVTVREAGPDDAHSLGNLMLTFVVFWVYVGFCQYLIVWIADLPAEVSWYLPRVRGSWGVLLLLLLAGQFVVPFLLLLLRSVKRRPARLAAAGAWLLLMHYLDLCWLVLPELHPAGVHPHWLDLAALAAVGGLGWAVWGRALGAPAPAGPTPRMPAAAATLDEG